MKFQFRKPIGGFCSKVRLKCQWIYGENVGVKSSKRERRRHLIKGSFYSQKVNGNTALKSFLTQLLHASCMMRKSASKRCIRSILHGDAHEKHDKSSRLCSFLGWFTASAWGLLHKHQPANQLVGDFLSFPILTISALDLTGRTIIKGENKNAMPSKACSVALAGVGAYAATAFLAPVSPSVQPEVRHLRQQPQAGEAPSATGAATGLSGTSLNFWKSMKLQLTSLKQIEAWEILEILISIHGSCSKLYPLISKSSVRRFGPWRGWCGSGLRPGEPWAPGSPMPGGSSGHRRGREDLHQDAILGEARSGHRPSFGGFAELCQGEEVGCCKECRNIWIIN